jgi:hypothetical protein
MSAEDWVMHQRIKGNPVPAVDLLH